MFSPEVRGAFANIGLHYQPSEAYESHLYQLEVLDEDLQSSGGPIYAMPSLISLPDGDAVGVCHQQNHRTIARQSV